MNKKIVPIAGIILLILAIETAIVYKFVDKNSKKDINLENINTEQYADDISLYSIKHSEVNPDSLATKVHIIYKGNEIFNFTDDNQLSESYIVGKKDNYLYFVNQIGGLGGFILYGNIGVIYKLNLNELKLEELYSCDYVYNDDFIFCGKYNKFNVLYFKTGITKEFTNLNLTGYQHGTYYISPKGENIAIPFSNINPNGIGEGGVMLLNLNTGEGKEIYKQENSAPIISGWENENTPKIDDDIINFSDNNIGIQFVYKQELGNIISENKDNLRMLSFSNYNSSGLFLTANNGEESIGRGAFWGDEAYFIINEKYIDNFCKEKENCTVEINSHETKFAKIIDNNYTMELSCSADLENNLCETKRAIFYYLYNPNSEYRGIVISSATLNNATGLDLKDKEYLMDIIMSSIKYIK